MISWSSRKEEKKQANIQRINKKSPLTTGRKNETFDLEEVYGEQFETAAVAAAKSQKTPRQITIVEEEIPTFLSVIFSWPCLLSLLTMCITQLRIVTFIGQLALFLRSSSHLNYDDPTERALMNQKVTFYLTVFGWMQTFCLLVAPLIGHILDTDLTTAVDDPVKGGKSYGDGVIFRRVQSLRNTRNAYLLTEVICVEEVPICIRYMSNLQKIRISDLQAFVATNSIS